MKLISACFMGLQIILFIALTLVVLWGFGQAVSAGAGFDSRFATTQLWRLAAYLAPYLALPVSIAFTVLFFSKGNYGRAIWLPLVLIAIISAAGRLYLGAVPDPIQENFGAREAPYTGFLYLPKEAIPAGFLEKEHRYSKRQYTITFVKKLGDQNIELSISEGDTIYFPYSPGTVLLKRFEYRGVVGEITSYTYKDTGNVSLGLRWLNPPKQRVRMFLTQTPNNDYSPEFLIDILKSMKEAK